MIKFKLLGYLVKVVGVMRQHTYGGYDW